jgi:hypothetical protein
MVDYSVVLVVGSKAEAETVRLYDGAHGRNETQLLDYPLTGGNNGLY